MTRPFDRLVAVDGVNGPALMAAARGMVADSAPRRTAISTWDASGIFGEVAVAGHEAGRPSPRTLLLLYAADLAFRIRWEIRPALAAGRQVVAAPYIDTAIAFGRAAGLDPDWLGELFHFALEPGTRKFVDTAAARSVAERKGFLEFGVQQMVGGHSGAARLELIRRAGVQLRVLARRGNSARSK